MKTALMGASVLMVAVGACMSWAPEGGRTDNSATSDSQAAEALFADTSACQCNRSADCPGYQTCKKTECTANSDYDGGVCVAITSLDTAGLSQ
jgi:hypothetical protein